MIVNHDPELFHGLHCSSLKKTGVLPSSLGFGIFRAADTKELFFYPMHFDIKLVCYSKHLYLLEPKQQDPVWIYEYMELLDIQL